jgi:hypothetical protein
MLAMTPVPGLTVRQTAILAALGAILWLVAALLLRALAPMGIYEGWSRVILYAAIVPGTWPFVLLLVRAAGLRRAQALTGVAVALAVATLLDGLALAWTPALYGATADHAAGACAAILWGAGVFLVLGAVAARGQG